MRDLFEDYTKKIFKLRAGKVFRKKMPRRPKFRCILPETASASCASEVAAPRLIRDALRCRLITPIISQSRRGSIFVVREWLARAIKILSRFVPRKPVTHGRPRA